MNLKDCHNVQDFRKLAKKINSQHCYILGKILAKLQKKSLKFKKRKKNNSI